MSEDINVNALAEAINDKMDRDAGNIISPMLPVFLVDVQYPTAENNYTWYRLYSDGWVEQGGQTNNTTDGAIAITLPIELADANYIPMITGTYITNTGTASNNGASKAAGAFADRTTTGFNLWKQSSVPYGWQVSSMSARPAVNPIGLLENTMKKVVDGEGVVDTTKLNSAETSIASFLNI